LAKGGRELAPVIADVAERSKGPQAWDDFFDYALWHDAIALQANDEIAARVNNE
jgi:hypothetical protein